MAKKLKLRQENKKHKKDGGHSSKREKARMDKGRTNGASSGTAEKRLNVKSHTVSQVNSHQIETERQKHDWTKLIRKFSNEKIKLT